MKAIFAIVIFGAICILVQSRSKWPKKVKSVEDIEGDGCFDIVPGVFCQRFSENGFCVDPRYQNIAKKNCIASCGNCPEIEPVMKFVDEPVPIIQ
uniref:ShKT domain-containing protein n=1 Tax=Acrobeloides nanus TaxID=290746 RepID=A0A914CKW7_9BILA